MEAAYSLDDWFKLYQQGLLQDFTSFFKACYSPLVRYANRLLHDAHKVGELVEEVILRVWEYRDRWCSLGGFKSLLYTALRNACFNAIQHSRRLERRHASWLGHQQVAVEACVHQRFVQQESLREIFHLAKDLPVQSRLIFHLYYQEGLSHGQIAAQLLLTQSTIRNQKARALKILRLRLKKVKKL
ncbi:sigma-70 family RNA polymerase sigma factor [Flavihumibacter petaseus]|uniref:Putative RNA polymerase ECF-type sigma factor n=1 Tax=Flavihumibacter petaseus NBRC 106054 TaxID=1220578 RepID=A0A0E9N620_9BACT|nr:sigma-70 family RNA polymerase sigma factor [Flavihumibacter petaseus]GAO45253.1 putative RNA polymerase ECF-type sigma factor [Flavihumibacter petaseus NBRC 106054]